MEKHTISELVEHQRIIMRNAMLYAIHVDGCDDGGAEEASFKAFEILRVLEAIESGQEILLKNVTDVEEN